MRGASRSMSAQEDISRAKENVGALQKQLEDLQAQFNEESASLGSKIDPMTEDMEKIVIKPKKTDITVQLVALVWAPYWRDASGATTSAF
jgi:peptidoglycan hydrolase CwlO-like protein